MRRLVILAAVAAGLGSAFGLATTVGRAATQGDCGGIAGCAYSVTVDGPGRVTGPGIDCPGDCSQTVPAPTGATLTETPDPGAVFVGWSTPRCGTNPTCFISVGGNAGSSEHITATFAGGGPSVPTVTVTDAGTGSGAVTSVPGGIDCGSTCSASFSSGAGVTLTAVAAAGSTFAGWSGDCSGAGLCALTIDGSKAVTATFVAYPKVVVSPAGSGTGSVTSAPAAIACGSTCTGSFLPGTQVVLTADSSTDALFAGWSGACTGSAQTCSLTADKDLTVTPTFVQLPSRTKLLARRSVTHGCRSVGPLPERRCSPGAIYADATTKTICASGYAARMGKAPAAEAKAVFAEYGVPVAQRTKRYEIDHIVPVELGGSNDVANLYPEAAAPAPGFHVKDKLERKLHALVCAGKTSLPLMQRSIASSWVLLYEHVFGSTP